MGAGHPLFEPSGYPPEIFTRRASFKSLLMDSQPANSPVPLAQSARLANMAYWATRPWA